MSAIVAYDPAQVETYLSTLFRNVDWEEGQLISLLGIGEKGTPQEGVFRERKMIAPAFIVLVHKHLSRWGEHQVASFIVPAVVKGTAADCGDVKLDKVAALTAIILDLDSGDTDAQLAHVSFVLGSPSMVVASGGTTEAGKPKLHLYWLLSEPSEDVERVASLRKQLAALVGGDQSFGRATQVIRLAGSVHAKGGNASLCQIISRSDAEYDLDELAEIIEAMLPMPGIEPPAKPQLPSVAANGIMDFMPLQDTAIAALHRDVDEGGDELTRWGEFSKVAGFNISETRAGRLAPEAAFAATNGWMLTHMNPPWPQARFDQEFQALVKVDIARHGPVPMWPNGLALGRSITNFYSPLPLIHFAEIKATLTNNWLVRNLLPKVGLAAIYGSPGAGKSFFALDMALRVAAGMPIDGRQVKPTPVIYIAAEGANGIKARVEAWRRHHGINGNLPFALIPCAVNLLDAKADISRLIDRIEQEVTRLGSRPGLIIIDTLAATFAGGDENTNAMVGYVNNMATMRDGFEAMVAVVHHRPKDQLNDTLRGHGSLMGAMDTVLRVDGSSVRTVTMRKQKDAEFGTPIAFRLHNVILGFDDEGQPIGAAIVDYVNVAESKPPTEKEAAALEALCCAMADGRGAPVVEAAWRARWEERLPAGMQSEARRKAWMRMKAALHRSGRVRCEADAWSVATPGARVGAMDFSPETNEAR